MSNKTQRIERFISELTKTFSKFKEEKEIKFAEYIVGDMTISAESLEEGSEIFQVIDGVNQPLADGKYVIEDKEYAVKDGKIASMTDAVAEVKVEVEQSADEVIVEDKVEAPLEEDKKEDPKIGELNDRISKLEEMIQSLVAENTKMKSDFSALPASLIKEVKVLSEPTKVDSSLAIENFKKLRNQK